MELADGKTVAAGRKLFEDGNASDAEWESPELVGVVTDNATAYQVRLNLRSTVFARNLCECGEARRGRVCAHAVAVALQFEASKRRGEDANNQRQGGGEADSAPPDGSRSASETPQNDREEPDFLQISEEGKPLRVLFQLPPNLESSVQRDAVAVKVEAVIGKEVLPFTKVATNQSYSVSRAQAKALGRLEDWCGGKPPGLVQLSGPRLRLLLDLLVDEPVVYWLKQPEGPIPWENGRLSGVHCFLPPSDETEQHGEADSGPEKVAHRSERETVIAAAAGKGTRGTVSAGREPAKSNPRREAETRGRELWRSSPEDYPDVLPRGAGNAVDDEPDEEIVVDGAPGYLAIRLPQGKSEAVQPLREILKTEGFTLQPANRQWWLRDRHKVLNFLAAHWASLRNDWNARFTGNFETNMSSVRLSKLEVATRSAGEGFVVDIKLGGKAAENELRRAMAGGRNYLEKPDGSITLLDRDSVEQLHELEKAISGQADRPFTPSFSKQLASSELADAEDVIDEAVEGWQPPEAWRERSRALKEVGALEPAPVRSGLDAILRTYQRIGVAWLWHLYRHDLGGILADEMGLGKTIQALALIECVRARPEIKDPALVVAPASLLENWVREASRFVPALKVIRHHGPKRAKEPVELEDVDLVVTSYGTLRQDAEILSTLEWAVIVGDEAQHIKNRRTRNARALTSLRSGGRFLLTGTPVENSLDDLLSLFSFLMPGYLSKAPANLSADERSWHAKRQAQKAAAYILRRTKREVAPELPEKIEKTFFCEMGGRQERFYRDTLEKTRREIFQLEMRGANAGRVRFAAFTELLRLRQACVDPRILEEDFPVSESAKLAAFEEVLDECLDAGSRLLVFSSFVSALQLIARFLDNKGCAYCYLDGQTRNRLAVCDRFNNDPEIPVFLVSLKAGGTGLNLTGADTVVHYDPWWNPAVEAQATDRAHRIGQEKVVTSIKLIVSGTIEEKVLEMQKEKAEILKELFEESEAANAEVGMDDIKRLLE